MTQKLRDSRKSAEITQLLNRISVESLETANEYNICIRAYGRARDWRRALSLLAKMRQSGVSPDVISFNAAISACAKGRQWKRALSLLDKMREGGVAPDAISFSEAISACEEGGQSERALSLRSFAREMLKGGVQ